MGMTFDGPNKLVILTAGTTAVSIRDLWSRWVDWLLTSDNSKYQFAFTTVGGDDIDLAEGTKIPIYAFLQNGWRIRPQEANHTLKVSDGVLLVAGGGDPFVDTVGSYRVNTRYSQPVQAISFDTGGGGVGGLTAQEVWEYSTRTLTAGGSVFAMPMDYKAVTNDQGATDPGAGKFKWNNATQNAATEIYLSSETNGGLDTAAYINLVPVGATLWLQDKNDASVYQRWGVTSITHNAGWHVLGVSLIASAGGNLSNNHVCTLVFNGSTALDIPTAQENADAVWSKVLP